MSLKDEDITAVVEPIKGQFPGLALVDAAGAERVPRAITDAGAAGVSGRVGVVWPEVDFSKDTDDSCES